ncbi:macrophage mannose receptor 1-like [Cololabis saira]|uniref:macrophage mannose receptor 1-like n=1 Tax=Cololabis saira TaxID=129043 RepID=UPI002AD201D9|nr:macrophage mannose receptor 1-like [Cololabis saira]
MRITHLAFVLIFKALHCWASDDSAFVLINKATGFSLVETGWSGGQLRWTNAGRLLVVARDKCLGVQGKSVGSEVGFYDCDEKSDLQKWECKNNTVLALQGQKLYIELKAENTAVLSNTIGPNNHLVIAETSSGPCTRTHREFYTIGGNAAGRPCVFPFLYKNRWFTSCTTYQSVDNLYWCAVETKFEHELWGYCPTNSKENWFKNPTTGANYQLNTQSALTWWEAETSCNQQGAYLLSITDPHQQAYITTLLQAGGGRRGYKLWTGLVMDPEHGWKWSNRNPLPYLNWDSGHPVSSPGQLCAIIDGEVQYSWQSSNCNKKLGYICYSKGVLAAPTGAPETGFCSAPWTPYNGHCFLLNRIKKTWSEAQVACRKEEGDLVSVRNIEDQSFVISHLGYASYDELWIGLNDRKTERLFDWSDHSTVSFTNWEFGRPGVSSDVEDCVLIRGENGKWADRNCREKHGYICMKTSASEPSGDEVEESAGCKTGSIRHGSYCYSVGAETKTFNEANEDCKSSNSYMADISTGVDNAFLVSLVGLRPEKHFWLGLSNQKNIDVFVWTNAESVRFTHWNAEMPGNEQGCVAMATGRFAGLWDVLPCTNKEKYICKHLAEGAVLTHAPPTAPSTTCADSWDKVLSRNFCFKRFTTRKTWYESRDYCRAIGGDLLSIHSAADLTNMHSYGSFWIGLSAPDPDTGYVWSDGSPVNFLHWQDEEPNNKNNVESCVEFYAHNYDEDGSWNDNHCEKYNNWICQIPTGFTPKPPPEPVAPDYNTTSDGWLEWKGNQYYINERSMAMEDARFFCTQRHGDLVTINSDDESIFLWKRISQGYSSYWIGLTVDFDGSFQWMDQSDVMFQKWDEGQPNFRNFDENCVLMTAHIGFWHDYNCGFEYKSICKRSTTPPANATVAPTVPPKGGCRLPWKKINSKCYNIVQDQNLTWHDARDKCKEMGGNLASIPSSQVQVFLVSEMVHAPNSDVWIGLNSLSGLDFYWTDGRPRSYYNVGSPGHGSSSFHYYGMGSISFSEYERYQSYNQEPKRCAVINTSPSLGIGKWIPKSCNDTNGFVCLRDVDPAVTDSPEPIIPSSYIKVLNDSLKVVAQNMSWDAAKKNCEDDGANLAALRTEWAQAYIENLALQLNSPVWIGLNKNQTNGYYRYIDGWHARFTKWGDYQPSRDGPCVYVDVDGKWKTASCSRALNSVCMKSTDVPPTAATDFPGDCPEDPEGSPFSIRNFWIPFRGYCYIFFIEPKKWPDASVNCRRHGGMLASIEDPAEQAFILTHAQTFKNSYKFFWLGLFKTHKGEWLWLDQAVMDYTNWDESEFGSIHNTHMYAGITTDGTWRTGHHWTDRPYICKKAKVMLPTPSATSGSRATSNRDRGHIVLTVVLVTIVIVLGMLIVVFFWKKSGHHLSIPNNLATFDNPLFFSNNRSQSELVDTKQLVENSEEENSQPVVMI